MIAKKTSKNQLTLPKKAVDRFPGVEYFEVLVEDSRISLVPVRPGELQEVQRRLERLGISENDVADAVGWARKPSRSRPRLGRLDADCALESPSRPAHRKRSTTPS